MLEPLASGLLAIAFGASGAAPSFDAVVFWLGTSLNVSAAE